MAGDKQAEKKREIRAEKHRNMTAANGGVNYTAAATVAALKQCLPPTFGRPVEIKVEPTEIQVSEEQSNLYQTSKHRQTTQTEQKRALSGVCKVGKAFFALESKTGQFHSFSPSLPLTQQSHRSSSSENDVNKSPVDEEMATLPNTNREIMKTTTSMT